MDGRHPPITDLFAESMTWRIEGRSAAAGSFADKQAFNIDGVLAPFGCRFAGDGAERFRPVTVRSVTTEGDTVVVVWDGHGVANDGVAYDNRLRLDPPPRRRPGWSTVWPFFDSIAFDDLWFRVTP